MSYMYNMEFERGAPKAARRGTPRAWETVIRPPRLASREYLQIDFATQASKESTVLLRYARHE